MSEIRSLSADEVPLLLPGARAFFAEGNLAGRVNEKHMVDTLRRYIEAGIGFVFVAGDAPFRGAIAGSVVPDLHTGDPTCMEFFWFVHPGERGSVGPRLLAAFEREARQRGARRIWMLCLVGENTERISKFYRRAGYVHRESLFAKEFD